jgi:hypothetical protein
MLTLYRSSLVGGGMLLTDLKDFAVLFPLIRINTLPIYWLLKV